MLTRVPQAGELTIMIGVVSIALSILVHLMALSVEFDAIDSKALPILQQRRQSSRW